MIFKLFQIRFRSLSIALRTVPTLRDWRFTIGLLLLYSLIYLPIGFGFGFLKLAIEFHWQTWITVILSAFIMPGCSEELFFRGFLLPHRSENTSARVRAISIGFSWIAFLIYHPLNPLGQSFFGDPIFLMGAGLLGIVCTITYLKSGSLWSAIFAHWSIVVIWLLMLGGFAKFR